MIKPRLFMVVPSLLAVQLLACGGKGDQPANTASNPAPVESSQATTTGPAVSSEAGAAGPAVANGAMSSPTPAASAASAPPADAPVTDEQILQITHTANQAEIEQAKLAQSRSKDPRVKKLAAMMIKDHTAADAKGMAVAKKDNLTPAPSTTSTTIESDARTATSTLNSQSGADFDKDYVDTQVKEHQAVLDVIDQKLLPSAKSPDLVALLTAVRPKIAMHLQHAQDLQGAMQKQAAAHPSMSGTH
jgi:putative membrane protein